MLESYAVGLLGTVVASVTWVGIQSAWRKVFPDATCDPDVLAGRVGCQGCGELCDQGSSEEAA